MIINDDILNWCKEYKGEKFHALLCDPPYHLTMDKRWANDTKPTPAMEGKVFERQTKGFMGKSWDGGDIAFRKETWEALKEHLYPGAFCFAFASTRGLHRMMVAIEDAGFIIHPTIFLFAFGSGFPKATRIDTQIQSKEEQEVVGLKLHTRDGDVSSQNWTKIDYTNQNSITNSKGANYEYHPTDPIAKRWTSHRYGLQALKPSCEPIICFQKRYKGKPVNCIVETGAGALNIDGGRIKIETKNEKNLRMNAYNHNGHGHNFGDGAKINNRNKSDLPDTGFHNSKGRWPSNLIIDKECVERFPMTNDSAVGISKHNSTGTFVGKLNKDFITLEYSDSGSAARYFKNVEMKIDEADPVFYTSKVSKEERNKGCEKLEKKQTKGGGGTYNEKLSAAYGSIKAIAHNSHPTLKPIDLTTYLATLLLPPFEYAPRRILVPFAGAGSEMIGCLKAGWEEIVGIELTAEYIPIIEARFEYYKKQIELEKSMQLFEPEIMESMNKANKVEESLFGTE